ncbi:MAG: tetratricopeptide repeat protein [Blastocatellia bacterium]
MSKKKWRQKPDSQKVKEKANPLENIDVKDEKQLQEGLKYITDLIEKKITLQEVAGIKDSDVNAILTVGALMYEQGRLNEAEDLLRGAVLLNNNSAIAHSSLGTVLTAAGKLDEALVELDDAIKLDAKDISAYVNRAEIHLQRADFQAASEDLKRAIELDPEATNSAANRAREIIVAMNQLINNLEAQIEQGQQVDI